jgi:hypothetical protein
MKVSYPLKEKRYIMTEDAEVITAGPTIEELLDLVQRHALDTNLRSEVFFESSWQPATTEVLVAKPDRCVPDAWWLCGDRITHRGLVQVIIYYEPDRLNQSFMIRRSQLGYEEGWAR